MYRPLVLITISLFLGSCDQESTLIKTCYGDCYSGSLETLNVGNCRAGALSCSTNGVYCRDEILPSKELCNGEDDDCNGVIDDFVKDAGYDLICGSSSVGACQLGVTLCYSGHLICAYEITPSVEVCNSLDDDCNGVVDDVVYDSPFCYSGPMNTFINLPCHPGVWKCVGSSEQCVGELLPQPETCNFIDDNCNGMIDDGLEQGVDALDIVFVVDWSGSMDPYIRALKDATKRYTNIHALDLRINYAVVLIPGDPTDPRDLYKIVTNFTDSVGVQLALDTIPGALGGGQEPSLDVIDKIASDLGFLRWRQDATKIVVMFTDEEPQTYLNPVTVPSELLQKVWDNKIRLYIFTDVGYIPLFQAVVPPPGNVNILSRDSDDILRSLVTIVDAVCSN